MTKFFVYLVALLSIASSLLASPDCSKISQRQILVDLYNSTSGLSWTNSWDIDNQDICSFKGVSCSGSLLDLSNNNLIGNIPDSFYCLNIFKTIDLSGNKFLSGDISKLASLQNVQFLSVADTSFSGEIPDFTSSALVNSLKKLNIDSTCVSGSVPETISKLKYLSAIRASNTDLQGHLPLSLYDLDLLEMDFSCSGVNVTLFDLEKFRVEKGLGLTAVPDTHTTHDGSQCHVAYASTCCQTPIQPSSDLCGNYYLAVATDRLVCYMSNIVQFLINSNIPSIQACRNQGGRVLTASDVAGCPAQPVVDINKIPGSLCQSCIGNAICYFAPISGVSSYCILDDTAGRECYAAGGSIIGTPQYCKPFAPCAQCQLVTEIYRLPYCMNGESSFIVFNQQNATTCTANGGSVITDCTDSCQITEPIITNECSECIECKLDGGAFCQIDAETSYCVDSITGMEACALEGGIIISDCQLISETECDLNLIATGTHCISGATCEQCAACWANQLVGLPYEFELPEECGGRTITIDNCLSICDAYNTNMDYSTLDPDLQADCVRGLSGSTDIPFAYQPVLGDRYACLSKELTFTYLTVVEGTTKDQVVQFFTQCLLAGGQPITNCVAQIGGGSTSNLNTTAKICNDCHANAQYYCDQDKTCYVLEDTDNCDGNLYCANSCPVGTPSDTFDAQCPNTETVSDILVKIKSLYNGFPASNNWAIGTPYCSFTGVDCSSQTLSIAGLPLTLKSVSDANEAGRLFMCLSRFMSTIDASYSTVNFNMPSFISPNLKTWLFDNTQIAGSLPYAIPNGAGLQIFNIARTQVGGAIPFSWGSLYSLKVFNAGYTKLRSVPPTSLYQLINLEVFDVSCTDIEESDSNGFFWNMFKASTRAEVPTSPADCPTTLKAAVRAATYENCQPFDQGYLNNTLPEVPDGSILCSSIVNGEIILNVVEGDTCPDGQFPPKPVPDVKPPVAEFDPALCEQCQACTFATQFFCYYPENSRFEPGCDINNPTNRAQCNFNGGVSLTECGNTYEEEDVKKICSICNQLSNSLQGEAINTCVDLQSNDVVVLSPNEDGTCDCYSTQVQVAPNQCLRAECGTVEVEDPIINTNLVNCTECMLNVELDGKFYCAPTSTGPPNGAYLVNSPRNLTDCINFGGTPITNCNEYNLECYLPKDQVLNCTSCSLLTKINPPGELGFCVSTTRFASSAVNTRQEYAQCYELGGQVYTNCSGLNPDPCPNILLPDDITQQCEQAFEDLPYNFIMCYIPGTEVVFEPVNTASACALLNGVILDDCSLFGGIDEPTCLTCITNIPEGNTEPYCLFESRVVPISQAYTRIQCELEDGKYIATDCSSFDTCDYVDGLNSNCQSCLNNVERTNKQPCVIVEKVPGQIKFNASVVPVTSEAACDARNGSYYQKCSGIFPGCIDGPSEAYISCPVCQTMMSKSEGGICINTTSPNFAPITAAGQAECEQKNGRYFTSCQKLDGTTCPTITVPDNIDNKFEETVKDRPNGLLICYYNNNGVADFKYVRTEDECKDIGGDIVDEDTHGQLFDQIPEQDCYTCLETIPKDNTVKYCYSNGLFSPITAQLTEIDCGLKGGSVITNCGDFATCKYPVYDGTCEQCKILTASGSYGICATRRIDANDVAVYDFEPVPSEEQCDNGAYYRDCSYLIEDCTVASPLPTNKCPLCQSILRLQPAAIGVCINADASRIVPIFTSIDITNCVTNDGVYTRTCVDVNGDTCPAINNGFTEDSLTTDLNDAIKNKGPTDFICFNPNNVNDPYTVVPNEAACTAPSVIADPTTNYQVMTPEECFKCVTTIAKGTPGQFCYMDNVFNEIGAGNNFTSTTNCSLSGGLNIDGDCSANPLCDYPNAEDCTECLRIEVTASAEGKKICAIQSTGTAATRATFISPEWSFVASSADGTCADGNPVDQCEDIVPDCSRNSAFSLTCANCMALTNNNTLGNQGFCVADNNIINVDTVAEVNQCVNTGGNVYEKCTDISGITCPDVNIVPPEELADLCFEVFATVASDNDTICYDAALTPSIFRLAAIPDPIPDPDPDVNGTLPDANITRSALITPRDTKQACPEGSIPVTSCEYFDAIPADQCVACANTYKPSNTKPFCYKNGAWTTTTSSNKVVCVADGGIYVTSCNDFSNCKAPELDPAFGNCLACNEYTAGGTRHFCIHSETTAGSSQTTLTYYRASKAAGNGCDDAADVVAGTCKNLVPRCTNYPTATCTNCLDESLWQQSDNTKNWGKACYFRSGSGSRPLIGIYGKCTSNTYVLDCNLMPGCSNQLVDPPAACSSLPSACRSNSMAFYCYNSATGQCYQSTTNFPNSSDIANFVNPCRNNYGANAFVSRISPLRNGFCTP